MGFTLFMVLAGLLFCVCGAALWIYSRAILEPLARYTPEAKICRRVAPLLCALGAALLVAGLVAAFLR